MVAVRSQVDESGDDASGIDDAVIPTYLFSVIGAVLEELHADPQQMVAGTGLSLTLLCDQQTRISFRQATRICANALAASPDPALGLRVAARESFSDWGMLGYAIASCKCAVEAIAYSNRFYAASTSMTVLYSGKEGADYVTHATPSFPAGALQPFLMEEVFGGIVNVVRALITPGPTGSSTFSPHEVQLSYAPPFYAHRYREFFQCPVAFNCASNRMIWHAEDAHRPFATHNPTTARLAANLCEQLLGETTGERGLVYEIRCRLLRSPGNFPTMQDLAAELKTSERSLSRSLKARGTSYRQLLDGAREKIATEYLTASELPLEDIAALTGFSDAGNFHRAFKKWTGRPPSALRRGNRR
jgi:AraC-like DNA-binding protein